MKKIVLILALLFIAGCSVPEHMHVKRGLDPENIDKDVRFRATYYFRTFDYCHSLRTEQQLIVPETDTLYRYRMTGQAHSLTTKVKFESGTLRQEQIDPFGTDVIFDPAIGGHRARSAEEAQMLSEQAALLDRFRALRREHADVAKAVAAGDSSLTSLRDQLAAAASEALKAYAGSSLQPVGSAPRLAVVGDSITEDADGARILSFSLLDEQQGRHGPIRVTLPADWPGNAATVAEGPDGVEVGQLEPRGTGAAFAVAAIRDTPFRASLLIEPNPAKPTEPLIRVTDVATAEGVMRSLTETRTIYCPEGTIALRRGFQVMGPEGWRTFDQDERLLMAMTTSAAPLIGTLTEYSGRVLHSRFDPAQALLPLVRESLRIVETQRALDRVEPAKADVAAIGAAALAAFEGQP